MPRASARQTSPAQASHTTAVALVPCCSNPRFVSESATPSGQRATSSAGQAGSRGIHLLALILAIIVTSVPLVFALVIFLPRRLRLIADMRGIHVTLRRALAQPELTPQILEILAGRAIYTLPYNQLLAYSHNPAEDWYLRRFEPLARAELEHHGLTVERYFGPRRALSA